MSEDLDFVYNNIYNLNTNSRDVRNDILNDCYDRLQSFMTDLGFTLANSIDENGKQRFKHNTSKNGIFYYEYVSVIDQSIQNIKIDIIIGPSILKTPLRGQVTSIFSFFNPIETICLDLEEIFSEKLTAALCRVKPAIRDYFDIWFAYRIANFDFYSQNFWNLFEEKVRGDNYSYSFNLPGIYALLENQIPKDLLPVLIDEKTEFSFPEAYDFVSKFYIEPK